MSLAALPTGRQGQLLALALLLAALGAIYLFAAAPLLELYAERATAVENARMLVPRLKTTADELPGLRARAAEMRATASTHKVTLDGSSDAIASANLQSHIAELAARGRGDDRQYREPAVRDARRLPPHRPALCAERPL